MKILLAPHGTRGDVQPLLALAVALRAHGHAASFLAPDDVVEWIRVQDDYVGALAGFNCSHFVLQLHHARWCDCRRLNCFQWRQACFHIKFQFAM